MTNRFISRGLMMTIAFILSCTAPLAFAQTGQPEKITITVNKKPLENVLEKLSKQYNYQFFYNTSLLKGVSVSASLQEAGINETMKQLLSGTGLQYSIKGKTIVITAIPKKAITKTLLNGRVTDNDGNVLPGVAIFTHDKSQGTVTDIDGRFSFPKPLAYGTVLNFSSVGMKPHDVVYSGEQLLQVVMVEDVKQLDAVIVTGFQTISRERATGAATIVKSDYLDKIQGMNLGSKLEGSTPGLVTYNGQTSIRGTSTFSSSIGTTPLLVMDGQPVTGISLNELNSDDIESVTVLKDAAATSLYGVRAANGVIVVTTKRGTSKKPNINISAKFFLDPLPSLDYMHYASTSDIIDYERDYLTHNPNYLSNPLNYFETQNLPTGPHYMTQIDRLYYRMAKGEITENQLNNTLDILRKNDYRKAYRDALQQMNFTQDYNISIAQASDRSNLYFSARYENQSTYNKNDDRWDRYTFYLKNELNLTSWFKLTAGANVAITNNQYTQAGKQGGNTFMPYDALYNEDGSYAYAYPYNYYRSQEINQKEGLEFMGYNAVEESTKNIQKNENVYWKLFTHADFKLLKGLDLGIKFQYEKQMYTSEQYDEEDSYYMRYMINQFATNDEQGGFTYYIPKGGRLFTTNSRWSSLNLRAQFNYQTTIAGKHEITALLGGEIKEDKDRSNDSQRFGYDDQKLTYDKQVDWKALSKGVKGQLSDNPQQKTEDGLSIGETQHRYVSAYFNASYSYDSRYALNGSVRIDQADLFGTDPKYRYRPLWSVGASWNISNEEFMKSTGWLDMLKLRVTYGITGNVDQQSSPYLRGSYGTMPNSSGQVITSIMTPPNKLLRWEKTSNFNIGIDFALFHKLTGSIDFYNRYSSDLLATKSLDPSTGFVQGKFNNGAMRNRGLELSLSYDWLKSRDWELNTNFTAAFNSNKIKEVGYLPTDALDMMRNPKYYYLKGDTYNTLYTYRYAGLTDTGEPSVYDTDGNIVSVTPLRDINVLVRTGQLDPKWSGALDVSLRWKQLSLFTKIVYYTGHTLRIDATPLYTGVTDGNVHEDIVNRWTPEHTDTDIPSMTSYKTTADREYFWKYSDYNTASASFIKVRNIGLSYTLPQQWINKAGLKGITLRAQVNNPCYWAANKRDIDPEAFSANGGYRNSEQTTSYLFGININF